MLRDLRLFVPISWKDVYKRQALGGLILWGMHRLLPQVHDHGTEQLGQARSNRELLHTGCFLCLGIALHNLPEGLAIGSGLAAGEGAASGYGVHLALLLTVHNVIEGCLLYTSRCV